MQATVPCKKLTNTAVAGMISAAVAAAGEMDQPQCIVIVDPSAVELASFRMLDAKVLPLRSARAKAQTAASTGKPSASLHEPVRLTIAAATDGAMTGLPGGPPIWLNRQLLGRIGVGSGSGDQHVAVARAALTAIGADPL